MEEKTIMLSFLVYLILVQNFGLMEVLGKNVEAPPAIPRVLLRSPQAPSFGWYTKNDDKDGQGDAFRPTSPGHSPGVGHDTPPNRP
ncbi:hypothetical protein P8452_75462 [Trifolium repens]|jgi:hypothetical protein|nr:precursor of CEP9 [Trifolium repens]WJX93995.1 hypothetical protein P8452_75462 [Trifolium repens]